MCLGIFFIYVIRIVTRNQFNLVFLRETHQRSINTVFVLLPMSHNLNIQVVTKLLFPPNQSFFGLRFTNIQYQTRHFTIKVPSEHHDIFFVLLNCFLINPRNIIHSFSICHRSQFDHVVITGLVLR